MHIACDVIFTQMSSNSGIKKHNMLLVAAIIKEFAKINEGVLPGKLSVIPTDASALTENEKKKATLEVNLIKENWEVDSM